MVETNPRAVRDALGTLNVCVSVIDEMLKSVPVVPIAKSCTDAVRVFRDVSPPPAPASDPQRNCPVVDDQRSLLLVGSEHADSPAPLKVFSIVRLVVEALVVEAVTAVKSVDVAELKSAEFEKRLSRVAPTAERLVVDALPVVLVLVNVAPVADSCDVDARSAKKLVVVAVIAVNSVAVATFRVEVAR